MDMNRTSKLAVMVAMASWLTAGKKLFMGDGTGYKRGRSVERRRLRGTSAESVYCCRCGSSWSSELRVAHETVNKVNGIKVRIKYYIHEECEHG